jgi:hypothetical protein
MGWWSKIKKAIKKVWRAVKTVVRIIVKAVVGLVMRIIHGIAEIFLFSVQKTLTLQIMILQEEDGKALIQPNEIDNAVGTAKKIFKDKFNIAIKAYGKPMVQTISHPAPTAALDVHCDGDAFAEEFGEAGAFFANNLAGWVGIPISLAFPVTAFVVRTIEGKIGCSIPITDYVALSSRPVPGLTGVANPTTLAHELAHTCLLAHRGDPKNLLFPDAARGTDVTWWQRRVARTSRHCTFW